MGTILENIHHYFNEEKIESLIFTIIGSISFLLALIFFGIIKYSLFKGIALPFLLIGIIQLIVGITIFNRSSMDIARVEYFAKNDSRKIKSEELPRIRKVLLNFTIYKLIEIVLLVVGITFFITYYRSSQIYWKGLFMGLLIQSSIMLTLDSLAEKRANTYLQVLLEYIEITN